MDETVPLRDVIFVEFSTNERTRRPKSLNSNGMTDQAHTRINS